MLNSRHSEAILSPSLSRITNRIRSSITEHFLHGMFYPASKGKNVSPMSPERSVTYVSGRSTSTSRTNLRHTGFPFKAHYQGSWTCQNTNMPEEELVARIK